MTLRYLDAHCHVQFGAYDADRDELIGRMKERGVVGIVVGCDYESSKQAVALAEQHEHLYASVGLHPNHERDEWYEIEKYRELAKSVKVVAIGECGLDYYRPTVMDEEVKRKQKAILADQIALAAELDKPLIIHSRPTKGSQDAYQDLIEILTEAKATHPHLCGDIHFFVGGVVEMQELIALGFTVSFTAVITFARDYDAVIRSTPPDSILSETDAPYVPPTNRPRGSRNDPLAVEDVVTKLAEIRSENVEVLRAQILTNGKRLFGIRGV